MPYFSSCCSGADEYICQKCGKIKCGKCQPSTWRTDITGHLSAGNVCPTCLKMYEPHKVMNNCLLEKPMSLYEHCKIESGLTNDQEIKTYMLRYYGVE